MLINVIFFFLLLFSLALACTALVHIFFFIPYVPTKKAIAQKMIAAAEIKPQEMVYDLGCGDGRLLFMSEKSGANAVGFEIAPLVYFAALIKKLIIKSKAEIRFQSLFNADISKADVIFCYLFPNVMPRLVEKIKKECKAGTRIISNTFQMPGMELHKILEDTQPKIYVYRLR